MIPKLTSPGPETALVTSNSIQVPAATLPVVATTTASSAGALFQLSPVSVQPPAALWIVPPFGEVSVTNSRR